MSNVNISTNAGSPGGGGGGNRPFYAQPSISIAPVPVVVTPRSGDPGTTRWVTLPPWPKVTKGPTPVISGGPTPGLTSPGQSYPTSSNPLSSLSYTLLPSVSRGPVDDTFAFPGWEGIVFPCPLDGKLTLTDFPATLNFGNCQGEVTLGGSCEATQTKPMIADKSATLKFGCTLFTGTTNPTPIGGLFSWPREGIVPIPTPVPEKEKEEDDDDPEGVYLSCKAWFFFVSWS